MVSLICTISSLIFSSCCLNASSFKSQATVDQVCSAACLSNLFSISAMIPYNLSTNKVNHLSTRDGKDTELSPFRFRQQLKKHTYKNKIVKNLKFLILLQACTQVVQLPGTFKVHLTSKYFLGRNESLLLSQLYSAFFSQKDLFY